MVKPRTEEEATESVREFLLSVQHDRGTTRTHCRFVSDIYDIEICEGACHYGLKPLKNPLSLGSGFLPTEEQSPIAMRFWNWISDPKKSPWKILLQNSIELVIPEGSKLPVGWILPKKTLRETPFLVQKNFAILTRVFTEKYNSFILWGTLVDKGMKETDAFYLASLFYGDKDKISLMPQLHGGHWPLTDSLSYSFNKTVSDQFDWTAFRTGNLNPSEGHGANVLVNGHFCKNTVTDYVKFDPSKLKTRLVGGRFSSGQYYDMNEIVDEFYKWQDQEGILA